MASFVAKGDLVLEPGCGPGILPDFLPEGVFYRGFDNNKEFVNYASKKHSGIYLGNILDFQNYCQADVVVACDILHHLKPKDRGTFIRYCFKSSKKKLIICEPGKEAKGIISKLWFEYIEQDGTNKPKFSDFWTKEKLKTQMENGFGIISEEISRKIKEIGEDFIVVYER